MKKTGIVLFATFVIFSVTNAAAQTASHLTPTVIHKQTLENQVLRHMFIDTTNVTRGYLSWSANNNPGAKFFGFVNQSGDYLGFFSSNFIQFKAPMSTVQMKVDVNGVTIGTIATETAVKLTVNGAIDVKGNIAAKYQDVAEWVPSFGAPTPGTVVVLSEDASNHVVASSTPYDTRVAGVVSTMPGVILGEPGANKVQVATTGRVKVMVDASAAPVRIGDLLVTSDKPGVAMKSLPIEIAGVKMHRPGTVVGKALEPLDKGTGEILVLLSLQ